MHALLGLWLVISLLPPVMLVAASLNSAALFLAGSNAQPLTVGSRRVLGGAEAGAEYGSIAA